MGKTGPEEIAVSLLDGQVTGKAWGFPQDPVILALHGWLDNAATFDRLAPLVPGYRFVALDLPGHGHSYHYPGHRPYHFIDAVLFFDELVRVLNLNSFILMGHSLGGSIAALYAGLKRANITKLILLESLGPLTNEPRDLPLKMKNYLEASLALLTSPQPHYADLETLLGKRIKLGDVSAESARPILERGTKPFEEGITWSTDRRLRLPSPWRLTEEQSDSLLREIDCPTLLVKGTQSQFVKSPQFNARQKLIKNLKIAEVPGTHYIHADEADQVAQAIRDFLN